MAYSNEMRSRMSKNAGISTQMRETWNQETENGVATMATIVRLLTVFLISWRKGFGSENFDVDVDENNWVRKYIN